MQNKGKLRYNKSELEKTIMIQLENLNAQGEHIDLLKVQNELLIKYNHKLIDEMADKTKEPKP